MICGIDAGTLGSKKLVFCWQTDAGAWEQDHRPPAGVFELAAVEGQIPNPKWARKGLMTLSFGAGAGLFAVDAAVRVVLPPAVWKNKLVRGGVGLPKAVFCRNIVQLFKLPADLDPEDDADQDKIDAIGILEAAKKLTPKEIKKHAEAFRTDPRTIFKR